MKGVSEKKFEFFLKFMKGVSEKMRRDENEKFGIEQKYI